MSTHNKKPIDKTIVVLSALAVVALLWSTFKPKETVSMSVPAPEPAENVEPLAPTVVPAHANQRPYVLFQWNEEDGTQRVSVWTGEQISYGDAASKCLAEGGRDTVVRVFDVRGNDECVGRDITEPNNKLILDAVNAERSRQLY